MSINTIIEKAQEAAKIIGVGVLAYAIIFNSKD